MTDGMKVEDVDLWIKSLNQFANNQVDCVSAFRIVLPVDRFKTISRTVSLFYAKTHKL